MSLLQSVRVALTSGDRHVRDGRIEGHEPAPRPLLAGSARRGAREVAAVGGTA